MDKLNIQILSKTEALQQEKEFLMVELIDKETKRIIGYIYEKDLIKFWKKKLGSEDMVNNRGQERSY